MLPERAFRYLIVLDQDPEHIIVARGSIIREDGREVGARESTRREIEPAAHTQTRTTRPRATISLIQRDQRAVERETRRAGWARPAVENATPLTITAIAALARAADGAIQSDHRVRHGENAGVFVRNGATLTVSASRAGPANRLVADKRAIGDSGDRACAGSRHDGNEIRDRAPLAD